MSVEGVETRATWADGRAHLQTGDLDGFSARQRQPRPTAEATVVTARRRGPSLMGAWLLLAVITTLLVPAATASSAAAADRPRLSVDNKTGQTLHLLFAESGTVHCRTVDHGQRACDDPQDLAALVSPWEVQPGQTIEVRYLSGGEPSPGDSVLNIRYAIGLGGDQAQLALHASGGSVSCRVLATKAYTCRGISSNGPARFALEPAP